MIDVGAQYSIHAGLKSLAGGLEEIMDVGINANAHGNLGFESYHSRLGPIHVEWDCIRIIGDSAADVFLSDCVKSLLIEGKLGKPPKILDGDANDTVFVRTEKPFAQR